MRRDALAEIRNESHRRESEFGYTLESRAREIAAAGNVEWNSLNKAELAAAEKAKKGEYALNYAQSLGEVPDPLVVQELEDQTSEADRYRSAKWAIMLLEAMFAVWLASRSLNLRLLISIAFGLALTILPAIAASAIVTAFIIVAEEHFRIPIDVVGISDVAARGPDTAFGRITPASR
jgi:hypothetical protein